MKNRFALFALLLAPILLGAKIVKTGTEKTTAEWAAAAGPVDPPALSAANDTRSPQGLTVHEWGTFTSVAGPDGSAIEWLPAGGPTDLPCFVNVLGSGPKGLPPTQQGGRANRARVRMETPVLYFYSPREETVDVKVSFPHGLITEWFPDAAFGPGSQWNNLQAFPNLTNTVEWNGVKVMPGATLKYRVDETPSHYYAARRTGADPLLAGKDYEKFLFYRGIASITPPLSARVTATGEIEVANLGGEVIPVAVLFENRGSRIGYRIHKNLSGTPVTLDSPALDQTIESLQRDLEAMLRDQGMYALEARAMVDTWRDSWFEQGTRIFYIVPSKTVDSILPLAVNPQPVSIARAFVGRMEVFTPTTQREVASAAENNDRAALSVYGRFLEPILHDFLQDHRVDGQIASIRAEYVEQVTACAKKRW